MEASTAKKVVAISSLALGGISTITSLFEIGTSSFNFLRFVFSVFLLVVGILLLAIRSESAQKGLLIAVFIFFCFCILIGLLSFLIPFVGWLLGVIIFGIYGVPFAFSIVYFVTSGREATIAADEDLRQVVALDDMERLTQLKQLLDSGAITEEEYEREKHKILG
jgi:hypothetical protein